MSKKVVVQDLTLTVPEDGDTADMPQIFADFSDGMPQATQTEEGLSTDVEVTPADINKIFEFNSGGTVDDEMVEHNLTIKNPETDDRPYFENGYGFQFAVATNNDGVNLITEESGVTFEPFNEVPPYSLAIVTRMSANVWLVAGGGDLAEKVFFFDESHMGEGVPFA